MNGAKVILECLKKEGIDTIFGYPGGAVIPLYDALYDYSDDFKHIRTSHEQGLVHAADGYARSTNTVGVCFTTSGPGATNAITGIATAFMDSSPMVVISGQVPTSLLGKDSFQEIDITGATLSMTKHNYLVRNTKELVPTIKEAFRVANSGSMVNIQYKRTLSLVTQRIKKDYSNDFVGIITGQQSLRNYRNDNPLMISNQQLNFKYIDDTFYLDIMCGYRLEVVLGKRDNENVNELKTTLEKVISKEYKVCDSSMQFSKNNKDVILNLVIDIPQNSNVYKPVEGRTLGIDLGIAVPIYMCLNDDTYKRKGLGDINNFLRVRKQMQTRRRKLQKDLTLTNGGKGRKKKTQLLDKLQENERNFVKTYSHALSKRVVEFAKSNKCEYINIEKLTKDGFDNIILRNWSYFELQKMIEYKAEREGIAVRYVNPAYTSQKCSRCGEIDKENRQTQANFKCTKCGFELNADHNAAINIARSIEFV
ncbi:RNA-guided endonuclease TnpB family protein [Clostridioides difficile]|nr:transposase [Clostridioides difficile]EKS6759524.1 transposase [Clostridioides difficile]MBY2593875.1 transposase [Clostridioides difficile]MBY2719278.1 transposase [Clostridioides difficile]MBY2746291.1 transposase [Clostridioides difficile]